MITTDRKSGIDISPKNNWGMRFQAAREAMNLSEKDAAARLHLKPHIINIIESERFSEGPPVIFMRGYIRSYGRMLNLPEKDLVQALSQLDFGSATSNTPAPSQFRLRENTNNSSSIWSTAFVALVLTALVGIWWWNAHVRNKPVVDAAALPEELMHTVAANPALRPATPETNIAAALNTAQTTAAPATTAAIPIVATTNSTVATAAPINNTALTTTAAPNYEPKVTEITPQPTAIPAPLSNQAIAEAPAAVSAAAEQPEPAQVASNAAATTAPAVEAPATEEDTSTTATNVANAEDSIENDEQPAPVKTHTSKNKTPNLADSEMSVPEEGLENEASE
jgi:cytoskeleton protein RodZ